MAEKHRGYDGRFIKNDELVDADEAQKKTILKAVEGLKKKPPKPMMIGS